MLIPPLTPSGRPIQRTEPVRSLHEIMSLAVRDRIVHLTGVGVPPARRDDIVQIPIRDLPPIPARPLGRTTARRCIHLFRFSDRWC
jgi:hypothetical protein